MWSPATCHKHSQSRMTAEVSVELRQVPCLIHCVTQLKLLSLMNTLHCIRFLHSHPFFVCFDSELVLELSVLRHLAPITVVCLSTALQPLVGPWPLFQFLGPIYGRTPWMGDQPVARPLPTNRTT
jgi:hypothetical protein